MTLFFKHSSKVFKGLVKALSGLFRGYPSAWIGEILLIHDLSYNAAESCSFVIEARRGSRGCREVVMDNSFVEFGVG